MTKKQGKSKNLMVKHVDRWCVQPIIIIFEKENVKIERS